MTRMHAQHPRTAGQACACSVQAVRTGHASHASPARLVREYLQYWQPGAAWLSLGVRVGLAPLAERAQVALLAAELGVLAPVAERLNDRQLRLIPMMGKPARPSQYAVGGTIGAHLLHEGESSQPFPRVEANSSVQSE